MGITWFFDRVTLLNCLVRETGCLLASHRQSLFASGINKLITSHCLQKVWETFSDPAGVLPLCPLMETKEDRGGRQQGREVLTNLGHQS